MDILKGAGPHGAVIATTEMHDTSVTVGTYGPRSGRFPGLVPYVEVVVNPRSDEPITVRLHTDEMAEWLDRITDET